MSPSELFPVRQRVERLPEIQPHVLQRLEVVEVPDRNPRQGKGEYTEAVEQAPIGLGQFDSGGWERRVEIIFEISD